jgi:hypothetical protein
MQDRMKLAEDEFKMLDSIAIDSLSAGIDAMNERNHENGYKSLNHTYRAAVDQMAAAHFAANMIKNIFEKGDDKSQKQLSLLVAAVCGNIITMCQGFEKTLEQLEQEREIH